MFPLFLVSKEGLTKGSLGFLLSKQSIKENDSKYNADHIEHIEMRYMIYNQYSYQCTALSNKNNLDSSIGANFFLVLHQFLSIKIKLPKK